MSSRGKTVTGTDGTDHTYRERIADQYRISAKYKSKLKVICFLQLIPLLLVFIHLFQNDWGIKITNHVLPAAAKWEYMFMLTLCTNIIGFSSLSKNSTLKLYLFIWGSILLGVLPITWGALHHYPEMAALIKTGMTRSYFYGYPLIALIYLILAMSIEFHILGIWYAYNLVQAWKTKGRKRE